MATSSGATDGTNTTNNARLSTLPEEILSNVACRLDSDDLFNLRITCRDIEAKILHEFATQHVGTKCFIFSTSSLSALSSIASSDKLRHCLRHIFLLTGHFPESRLGFCPALSARQELAYAAYATDQRALRQGLDRKLLVEAFRQLPSLRTVMLVDHARLLPDDLQWHGLNTFRRKTGYNSISTSPPPDELFGANGHESTQTYQEWLSHVFRTMVHAVADSGTTTITKFGTRTISKSHSGQYALSPLLDTSFSTATITKLIAAFPKLEEVELQLRTLSLEQASNGDLARAKRRMGKFAQAFHKINKLDLSFDHSSRSGDVCATILKGLQLSTLSSIRLHGVSIGCAPLAKAVCDLISVRDVTFDCIDLCDGSWVSILTALDKLPLLDHLHIFYASSAGQKVYFLEQDEPEPADPMSAYMFGGPPSGGAGDEDGQWQDTDGEDDSDDEPPELFAMDDLVEDEPSGGNVGDYDTSSSVVAEPSLPAEDELPSTRCKFSTPDWKAPCGHSSERGYLVCLQGDEVHAQIPKMIKEHNIAGEEPLIDMFGMLGAPPGANGPAGGLLGAMPVAAGPVAAPAPGAAANPNATATQALQQSLQQAFNQIGGMFQGTGPAVASANGAAPANGALFPGGAPPAGWAAQGIPITFGQLFQGVGLNGTLPAGNGIAQAAAGAPAPAQNVSSAATAAQEDNGVEEDNHGALDDVE